MATDYRIGFKWKKCNFCIKITSSAPHQDSPNDQVQAHQSSFPPPPTTRYLTPPPPNITNPCKAQLAVNQAPQISYHYMYPSGLHDTAAECLPAEWVRLLMWGHESNWAHKWKSLKMTDFSILWNFTFYRLGSFWRAALPAFLVHPVEQLVFSVLVSSGLTRFLVSEFSLPPGSFHRCLCPVKYFSNSFLEVFLWFKFL